MDRTTKLPGFKILWVTLIILQTAGIWAQDRGPVQVVNGAQVEFQQALKYYLAADYEKAFAAFEALANTPYLHQYMTATLLMAGKSQ